MIAISRALGGIPPGHLPGYTETLPGPSALSPLIPLLGYKTSLDALLTSWSGDAALGTAVNIISKTTRTDRNSLRRTGRPQ